MGNVLAVARRLQPELFDEYAAELGKPSNIMRVGSLRTRMGAALKAAQDAIEAVEQRKEHHHG
jgi:hypothetical protein